MNQLTKKYLLELTYEINGAAIEVHKELGPGLLETVYHTCMAHELDIRGISFESEKISTIECKGLELDALLRCDLFIEKCIAVELKSVKSLEPINIAQTMTYMRLLKAPKGILINFNCNNIIKDGQKTFVNELFRDLPDE